MAKQLQMPSRHRSAMVGKSVFTFSDALTYSLMSTVITHQPPQVHKDQQDHREQPDQLDRKV
jgi:hypothetical protein